MRWFVTCVPGILWFAALVGCGGDGDGNDGSETSGDANVTTTTVGSTSPTSAAMTSADDTGSDASTEPADATSSGDATTGPPQPTDGCGLPATSGAVTRMIDVAGVTRTFTVTIPDAYDPAVAHPVVFGFHGLGGSGAGYYIPGGLEPAAIIVGPDASPAGGAWNTVGDLEFVDAILEILGAELCIDGSRVFASGYSNGGFMADAVACARADVFRGVAVMEGGSGHGGACGQTAMWIMHNQDDMTVSLDYGTAMRDFWLMQNGCSATTQPIEPMPCEAYDGCAAGNPVVWCSPATGGHNPNYDAALAVPNFFNGL